MGFWTTAKWYFLIFAIVFVFLVIDFNHFHVRSRVKVPKKIRKKKTKIPKRRKRSSDEVFIKRELEKTRRDDYINLVFVEKNKKDNEFKTIFNYNYSEFLNQAYPFLHMGSETETVCSIGATNVGKSTFSNEFFGTNFEVLDVRSVGRKMPTTYGVVTGFAKEAKTDFLLLDTQGLNSAELRSKDEKRIDKKMALFSFLVGDQIWVHINENEVAETILFELLEPLFFAFLNITTATKGNRKDYGYLYRKRDIVFFVHRMDNEHFFKSDDTRNAVENTAKLAFTEASRDLERKVKGSLSLSEFFELEVHYFHHYLNDKEGYRKDMKAFKKSFEKKQKKKKRMTDRKSRKLSDIVYSVNALWSMVVDDRYVMQSDFKYASAYECVGKELDLFLAEEVEVSFSSNFTSPQRLEKMFRRRLDEKGCRVDSLEKELLEVKVKQMQDRAHEIIANSGICFFVDLSIIILLIAFTLILGLCDTLRSSRMICPCFCYLFFFVVLEFCLVPFLFFNFSHVLMYSTLPVSQEARFSVGAFLRDIVGPSKDELSWVQGHVVEVLMAAFSSVLFNFVDSTMGFRKELNVFNTLLRIPEKDDPVGIGITAFLITVVSGIPVMFLLLRCAKECLGIGHHSTFKYGGRKATIRVKGRKKNEIHRDVLNRFVKKSSRGKVNLKYFVDGKKEYGSTKRPTNEPQLKWTVRSKKRLKGR